MRTSQIKKGSSRSKPSARRAAMRKAKKDGYWSPRPPLDRRAPGWQQAEWDPSIGSYVIWR